MKKRTKIQLVMSMGIVMNVVCAFMSMTLTCPLYMDSIGTILVAGLLGPKYAMMTGVLGSLVSGMTFDVYSFYYAPVQLLTGFFAGTLYHTSWLQGKRMPIGSILVGVPTSLLSACITALLFNGITSGGSSMIVMFLNHMGVNLVLSILVVQVMTDYLDKLFAVYVTHLIIERGHLMERWGISWRDTVKSPTKQKEKLYY